MNEKRQAIITATVNLISEQGFEITAVSDIADKAEVGNGTVYRNFGSKDNLIKEVYLTLYTEMVNAWVKDFDVEKSIWERFQIIWNNVLNFYLQHPKEMIFMEQIKNSPYFNKNFQVEDNEVRTIIQNYHQEGLEEGELQDMPEELRNIYTVDAIHLIAKQILDGKLELTPELREMGIMASWNALSK